MTRAGALTSACALGALCLSPQDHARPSPPPTSLPVAHPLDVTAQQIGARAVQERAADTPTGALTGAGVTIALFDTRVDLRHPAMFRADGPRRVWLDVDGDGRFSPGVDGVDLNGDGALDRNETLRALRASTFDTSRALIDRPEAFDARRDWLFADMNRDQTRNAGRAAGFFEEDPAYGEPLFVVEDVDRDGVLDPDERLIQLRTTRVRVMHSATGRRVRGVDLIDALADEGPRFHGTAVASILVGGPARWHAQAGIAPGADLLVYVSPEEIDVVTGLADAAREGAQVALHEYNRPFTRPLDGSTPTEAAMGEARAGGMIQVTAAGNLNRGDKSTLASTASGPLTLTWRVPDDETTRVYGALQWVGDAPHAVTLRTPGGDTIPLPEQDTAQQVGLVVSARRETTARGNHLTSFSIVRQDGQTLTRGVWSFTITAATPDTPLTALGRITDPAHLWRGGVAWVNGTRDVSTLSFPSSADAAFVIGAHGGRATIEEDGTGPGELRVYSGRGPRLDGDPTIDLTAPDDPFTALGLTDAERALGWPEAARSQFGGTSGAAAHVAGAFALLVEARPDATPDVLEGMLRDSAHALPDASPEAAGAGMLDLHRALFGTPAPQNTRPTARLTATCDTDTLRLDASQSDDPDGDALEVRFDVDHDGVFDTPWTTTRATTAAIDPMTARRHTARVAVRDAHGAWHGALASCTTPGGAGMDDDADMQDMGAVMDEDDGEEPRPTCLCASPSSSPTTPAETVLWYVFLLGCAVRRRSL